MGFLVQQSSPRVFYVSSVNPFQIDTPALYSSLPKIGLCWEKRNHCFDTTFGLQRNRERYEWDSEQSVDQSQSMTQILPDRVTSFPPALPLHWQPVVQQFDNYESRSDINAKENRYQKARIGGKKLHSTKATNTYCLIPISH